LISFWPTLIDKEPEALLSPEERQEIEAELAHYPHKQAVSIDAMKIVQRHRGWVSDESLRDIAEFLGMSAADLDGVATFYNLIFRKPVGRHVIMVCDSVSCWIMGCDRIREHLSSRLGIKLGETTQDGRFTLLPIVCLGACDHAPVVMVDGDLHQDLDPQRLDGILEKYE
jgi:NADH-quinone oxidoreductase subunit E